MKLRIGAVVVALSSLLPACSAAGDAEPAAAVTEVVTEVVEPEPDIETVDAFHFESGTLELGPFDPLEVYPDVFDPCQEISDEEFAKAGFETDRITTPMADHSILSCTLLPIDRTEKFGLLLAGNIVDRADLELQSTIIAEDVSQILPNMFLYVVDGLEEHNCSAAVATERGHLIAFSVDGFTQHTQQDHCTNAIQTLENLARS